MRVFDLRTTAAILAAAFPMRAIARPQGEPVEPAKSIAEAQSGNPLLSLRIEEESSQLRITGICAEPNGCM